MTFPRDTLQILEATPADAPALLALQHAAFRQEAEDNGVACIPPLSQDLAGLLEDMKTHAYLKALQGGELVGMARGRVNDEDAEIGRLAVKPGLQGRGIGRALLDAIEARFSRAARYELFTGAASLRNIRIYEARGYRVFRTEAGDPALVFMEKRR